MRPSPLSRPRVGNPLFAIRFSGKRCFPIDLPLLFHIGAATLLSRISIFPLKPGATKKKKISLKRTHVSYYHKTPFPLHEYFLFFLSRADKKAQPRTTEQKENSGNIYCNVNWIWREAPICVFSIWENVLPVFRRRQLIVAPDFGLSGISATLSLIYFPMSERGRVNDPFLSIPRLFFFFPRETVGTSLPGKNGGERPDSSAQSRGFISYTKMFPTPACGWGKSPLRAEPGACPRLAVPKIERGIRRNTNRSCLQSVHTQFANGAASSSRPRRRSWRHRVHTEHPTSVPGQTGWGAPGTPVTRRSKERGRSPLRQGWRGPRDTGGHRLAPASRRGCATPWSCLPRT